MTVTTGEPVRWTNKITWWGRALELAAWVTTALVVGWLINQSLSTPAWAPLGEFPEQQVLDDDGVISVSEDGVIPVRGSKEYREDVSVFGTFGIICEDPTFSFTFGSGSADRTAGVLVQEFENRIPQPVVDSIAESGPRVCHLVGTETPTDGEREGISRTWRSEDFVLVP